jgi:hypothetical protein
MSSDTLPPWVKAEVERYQHASLEPSTARAYRATFRDFVAYYERRGYTVKRAYPLLITNFVVFKCEQQLNTASAMQWRSHVECHARYFEPERHVPWTRDDWSTWNMALKGMNKEIGNNSVKRPGLTTAVIRRVHASLQPRAPSKRVPRDKWDDWYYWVYLLVLQQAMLRPSEACDGALLVRDITLEPSTPDAPAGARLMVHGSGRRGDKGAKRDGLKEPKPVYIVQRHDELDVIAPLRFLLSSTFKLHADRPLLTKPVNGVLSGQALSADDMTTWLRRVLTRAKVENAAAYTIRSGRSGRRTDLQDAQVPDQVVDSLGRWKHRNSNNSYRRMTPGVMSTLPRGASKTVKF